MQNSPRLLVNKYTLVEQFCFVMKPQLIIQGRLDFLKIRQIDKIRQAQIWMTLFLTINFSSVLFSLILSSPSLLLFTYKCPKLEIWPNMMRLSRTVLSSPVLSHLFPGFFPDFLEQWEQKKVVFSRYRQFRK